VPSLGITKKHEGFEKMEIKNNLYYENVDDESLIQSKIKNHSLVPVWEDVAKFLKTGHQQSNILQVECGLGYLVYYLMNQHQFNNVHGIDMRSDLIENFQKNTTTYKSNVRNYNFFRLSEKDLNSYDVFIFSKILEYCENDMAYIRRIPKDKMVVLMYPSQDDGLCLHHFDSLSQFERYTSHLLSTVFLEQVEIFKNTEYMVDSKMNLLVGIKK
jgi:hypothetical protein